MANTFTTVLPKILARGLLALSEQAVMPSSRQCRLFRRGRAQGPIDVQLPSAIAATDSTLTQVQIALSNWKKVDFHLSDKEMMEIDRNEALVPMQISEVSRALANAMNASVYAAYAGVYGYAGTAATTPLPPMSADATEARKLLNKRLAPRGERRAVLDLRCRCRGQCPGLGAILRC